MLGEERCGDLGVAPHRWHTKQNMLRHTSLALHSPCPARRSPLTSARASLTASDIRPPTIKIVEPATTELTVTLVEHTNFAVSDRTGDMLPGTYHGFFVADTRHLSRLVVRINGQTLDPLKSGGSGHAAASFYLANPDLPGLPAATISVFRDRRLSDDLSERIRLISYARDPMSVEVCIEVDADFADIFEVRGRRRMRRHVAVRARSRGVDLSYEHRGYHRGTSVTLSRPVTGDGRRLNLKANLAHGQPWDLNMTIRAEQRHGAGVAPLPPRRRIDPNQVRDWVKRAPSARSSDRRIERAWQRGISDLASLLLTGATGEFLPAAGLPWYLAVFGRDASITAMQSLILGPDIAFGTLRQLAALQGRRVDGFREEEPGKIPHEVRSGELAQLGRIPFGRYYGSVDATPLFVMLFVATCRWSGLMTARRRRSNAGLPSELAELLPAAEAALAWLDRGVDADGLLRYRPTRRSGIRNQVWKDSNDSMRYASGSVAEPPIAAVEVQGYVVAARRGMADVLDALGRDDEAATQRLAADRLASVLDERFWMPNEATYALGLDAAGRQIDGVTSNPGQLLWAGAVPVHRAAAVAERLLAPDLFTGWGIRTLSSSNPGYNPIGYHVGSVWPHDTSLAAAGLARYGLYEAAQRIIDGLLDAANADPVARLPELLAGFDRATTPELVPYPTACAPQAWATGAIFLSVLTLLAIPDDRRSATWAELSVERRGRGAWRMRDLPIA